MLDEETRAWAANALGMKEQEITAVADLPEGGTVVETHDGQRTLVAVDGSVSRYDGPVPAGAELTEDDDVVPAGTSSDVLAWVGDDPVRAARALEVEKAGQGRSTLIANLEKLAQG